MEPKKRSQGETPRRVGRLAALRAEVGEVGAVAKFEEFAREHGQGGRAAAGKECRAGTPHGQRGRRRRAQAEATVAGGATPGASKRESHVMPPTLSPAELANGVRSFGLPAPVSPVAPVL